MNEELNEYRISEDRASVQIEEVAALLKSSYWAYDRSKEAIEISIKNSVCFSMFHGKSQIGFARVVTDYASVAYIADLIIREDHRGKGLGKLLTKTIVSDPRWENIFKFLATDDAHGLYEKFGFLTSAKLMSTKI